MSGSPRPFRLARGSRLTRQTHDLLAAQHRKPVHLRTANELEAPADSSEWDRLPPTLDAAPGEIHERRARTPGLLPSRCMTANVLWLSGAAVQVIGLIWFALAARTEWKRRAQGEPLAPAISSAVGRVREALNAATTYEVHIDDGLAITSNLVAKSDPVVLRPGDPMSEINALKQRLEAVEAFATSTSEVHQKLISELTSVVDANAATADRSRLKILRDSLVGSGALVLAGSVIQLIAAAFAVFTPA